MCFSQGNLQYRASADTWRFADHQYDCLGDGNNNISSTYSGWIDLFGWGTSGYNHGAVCYQPWSTSTNEADYYAYGNENDNLYDNNGRADWGYNKISNGGNQYGLWRTLTGEEWEYIINGRSTSSGYRYVKATVNDVKGLILLPDHWNADVYTLNRKNAYWVQFDANIIGASDWTNVLEAHGAVFLPLANSRIGSSYYNLGIAYYRSSNPGTCLWFYDASSSSALDSWVGTNSSGARRCNGYAVRLVQAPSSGSTCSIVTVANPSTGGKVTGAGNYMAGALCTLHATPNGHYTFVRWTKNGSTVSTDPTYSFTVTESASYVAEFAAPVGGTGLLNGMFSIAENTYVNFSKGNLQYQASTSTWRFAMNQYECVGDDNENVSPSYNGWIDLFGWGTSGYNHGAVCYQPYSISDNNGDYYAYGQPGYSLFEQTGKADWGYNAISNGVNSTNVGWRTLTSQEWYYLFNTRNTASGNRYAKAIVNGVSGVILLPDNWDASYYELNDINNSYGDYLNNNISDADWTNVFEIAGAVFLPAANRMISGSIVEEDEMTSTYRDYGFYWSASSCDNDRVRGLYFSGAFNSAAFFLNEGFLEASYPIHRSNGASVRLVLPAQTVSYSIVATSSPAAGGDVSGQGSYTYGSYCTLTATANEGYAFVRWTKGGNEVSTNPSISFMVTESAYYVAEFGLVVSGSASPSNGGTIIGLGNYDYGSTATLVARANSGYTFDHWMENGEIISVEGTYSFTVKKSRSLVAVFAEASGTGKLNGVFSVGEDAQVSFSRGNLQYQASTNTWRFATNQYDYVGNTNNKLSETYSGWIDLFGWGTSNYNHGAVCYQPWSATYSYSDFYAYGSNNMNLFNQSGLADWGCNAIINGRNVEHSGWRTLTHEEWKYLFNTRNTSSNIRYAKANVNNINGVIVLPDDWNASYYSLDNVNTNNADYTGNTISAAQWVVLEQHGAVFLPAAGYRTKTSLYSVGNACYYWSSSYKNNIQSWNVYCDVSSFNAENSYSRYGGMSVRLVRVPQEHTVAIQASSNNASFGSVTGAGSYVYGSRATLKALPKPGYIFLRWTENGTQVSLDPVYSFTVTNNRNLVAVFAVGECQGQLNGVFSVSENTRVSFSRGNLQYQASTNTWRFAPNQYDCIGEDNANISQSYNGWIDLFGWGTSGFNHGAVCYQPWSTSCNNNDYYAYGQYDYWLCDQTGQADWGFNAISNGGNQLGQWRTLTPDDWNYLLSVRPTESGLRWVSHVTVNGVNGAILLPDDWSTSYYSFDDTNISASLWNTLEQYGAVFLPAAGERTGTSVGFGDWLGYYWTNACKYLNMEWSLLTYSGSAYMGASVRLARTVPNVPCTISVSSNPSNGGTVTGDGTYQKGQTCTLSAIVNTGYTFTGWTKDGTQVSTNPSYSFTVTENAHYVAEFAPINYAILATANPSASGMVSGVGTYDYGSICTLVATPYSGFGFESWMENGSVVSTDASYSFTVTNSRTLVANFTAVPMNYIIGVSASPSNGGTVTGSGIYQEGETCTLTASANPGYAFISWTKNGVQMSTSPSYSFIVTENAGYVAEFGLITQTQTLELSSGWNWVSINVEITMDDLKAAILAANPGATPVIKSKGEGQASYNGIVWVGALRDIDLSQMYEIKVANACTVMLEGAPVDPSSHTVTIKNGANWIAYPLNETMSVTNVFAGFAVKGDNVKSKSDGQATWNNIIWSGALRDLEPGKGYIYISKSTGDRTFTFPTGK